MSWQYLDVVICSLWPIWIKVSEKVFELNVELEFFVFEIEMEVLFIFIGD